MSEAAKPGMEVEPIQRRHFHLARRLQAKHDLQVSGRVCAGV
jgi:hypothetical protein